MNQASYRPCTHCGHRHYFMNSLTDEGDAEDCPMCGNELYPSTTIVGKPSIDDLLHFVQHKTRCAALGVMWHQGPCDCGLSLLLKNMSPYVREAAGGGALGPGAVICTTCGDKKTLEQREGTIECPNCKD